MKKRSIFIKIASVLGACALAIFSIFLPFQGSGVKTVEAINYTGYKGYLSPSMNVLPYPYYRLTSNSNSGLSFYINEDFSVTVNGTCSQTVAFYLFYGYGASSNALYVEGYNDFTYSILSLNDNYDTSNGSFAFGIKGSGNKSAVIESSVMSVRPSVTLYDTDNIIEVNFVARTGSVFNNYTFKPWVNPGTTRYPFLPNFNTVSNDSYNNGLEVGMNFYEGYPFTNGPIKLTYKYLSESDEMAQTVDFHYVEGGSGFRAIDLSFWDIVDLDRLEYIRVDIDFFPVLTSEVNQIYLTSDYWTTGEKYLTVGFYGGSDTVSSLNYSAVPLTFANTLGVDIPQSPVRQLYNIVLDSRYLGLEPLKHYFIISIPGQEPFKSGYQQGYTEGYDEGYNDKGVEEFNNGYEYGMEQGYDSGYNAGYDKGVNSDKLFYNLISSVIDVPLTTITEMFNIEVLGVNLSAFAISLFSLALIITIVRLFI